MKCYEQPSSLDCKNGVAPLKNVEDEPLFAPGVAINVLTLKQMFVGNLKEAANRMEETKLKTEMIRRGLSTKGTFQNLKK